MKDFYQHSIADFQLYQTPNLWQTYRSYNYILAKGESAIVIDPGDVAPITHTLKANHLKLEKIFLTHHHGDHVGATKALKEQWDCPVLGYAGDQSRLPSLDQTYQDQDRLDFLGAEAQVMFLPGHTLGLCVFYLPQLRLAFSNDLLFSLGCGRVFEGTYQQMFHSLQKLRQLPDDTLILCSHEYTAQNLKFALSVFPKDPALLAVEKNILDDLNEQRPSVPTTLGFEKTHNPFLRWDDPGIRQTLAMEQAEDWQVFAKIRQLKDQS